MTKKDYIWGIAAGLLIGVLAMLVLNATKTDLYNKIGIYLLPLFLIGTPLGLWVAGLIAKKIAIVSQIAKFGVSGVLNTLVDWGVLALLIFYFKNSDNVFLAGLTFYALYKAIAFIVANINSYYWNKFWTFAGAASKKTKEEYLQFFIVSIIGFVLNTGIASVIFKLTVSGFGESQAGILGAAAGSVIVFIWNFLGYKFIVFRSNQQSTINNLQQS